MGLNRLKVSSKNAITSKYPSIIKGPLIPSKFKERCVNALIHKSEEEVCQRIKGL